MTKNKTSSADKSIELAKYRDLVIATLDYFIDSNIMKIKSADIDSDSHFRKLKDQTIEHFKKGRLSRLKQWFRDLTEVPRETGDFTFGSYLKNKTGQDIDIFKGYYDRVDKIIAKGKITTEYQFYDIISMVDQIPQATEVHNDRLTKLNDLLADYEKRRAKKRERIRSRLKKTNARPLVQKLLNTSDLGCQNSIGEGPKAIEHEVL